MLVSNGFATLFLVFHPYYSSGFEFTDLGEDEIGGESFTKCSSSTFRGCALRQRCRCAGANTRWTWLGWPGSTQQPESAGDRAAAGLRPGDRAWPRTRCSCSACAMTLLAVGYLTVQYMLALGRVAFLPALARRRGGRDRAARRDRLEVAARASPRSCSALQAAAALSVLAIGLASRPARGGRAVTRLDDRGLADRGAGASGWRPAPRARGPTGAVVEIGSFRGRSTVVLAPRRGRRWSRSTRTPAAIAGRRRSRPTPRAATPTTPPSTPTWTPRASPTGCATCASSRPTRSATSPARSRCSTSTARTASARRGRTWSSWGAPRRRPAGRCSSTTRSPRSA